MKPLKPCLYCGGPKPRGRGSRYCSDECRHAGRRAFAFQRNAANLSRSRSVKVARGCDRCGYERSARALHWHHRDPATKLGRVTLAWLESGKAHEEMAKCDLLCANCHYESHDMGLGHA